MSEVVLASQVTTSTIVWYGVEFETYNLVLKLSSIGSTPYGYRVVQYQNGIQVDILTVAPQTHMINSTTEVDLGTVTGRIGIYLNNDFGETVTIAVADNTELLGTLLDVVTTVPANSKRASATDVPCVRLESKAGKWYGDFGIHDNVTLLNSLPAANIGGGSAIVNGATALWRP